MKAANEYINKKFFQKDIIKATGYYFGTKKYKRMFIHARLKRQGQLKAFKDNGIICKSLKFLVSEANKNGYKAQAFIDFQNLAELVRDEKPFNTM